MAAGLPEGNCRTLEGRVRWGSLGGAMDTRTAANLILPGKGGGGGTGTYSSAAEVLQD